MLTITEIFTSIQGESTFQGWPCTFVRLTGCNLRCRWCDTVYAYDGGTVMTVSEVVEKVETTGVEPVEITGGEPLLQDEAVLLMKELLERSFTVLVETNGSLDAEVIPAGAVRIIDVKCPGSGESDKIFYKNLENPRKSDEFKFVLTGREDFKWAVACMNKYALCKRATVLFSPVSGMLDGRTLSEWIIEERLPVRLNLQLHKTLWPEKKRGV